MFNVSAQATMKSAAKCDKYCEMQTSVNQLDLERKVRLRVLFCKLACTTVSQRMRQYDGKYYRVAARYDVHFPSRAHLDIARGWYIVDECFRQTIVLTACPKTSFLIFYVGTWCWVRQPVEFKHISKRRSKN